MIYVVSNHGTRPLDSSFITRDLHMMRIDNATMRLPHNCMD
jgi:hypothetical protein